MEEKINELKEFLKKFDTYDILGFIATKYLVMGNSAEEVSTNSDIFKKTTLDSPHKQYLYLIALLMSTEYSEEKSKRLSKEDFIYIESQIKDITNSYIENFIPKEIKSEMRFEEKDQIELTMRVFLDYFNTDILRYENQIIDRIKLLCTPFNKNLIDLFGVGINEFIELYYFSLESFKQNFRDMSNAFKRANSVREEMLIKNVFVPTEKRLDIGRELSESTNNLNTISITKLTEKFGVHISNLFIDLFSIKRGEVDCFYYNIENPAEKRPLYYLNDNRLFLIHPKYLLSAIYEKLIETLENLDNMKEIKFYENRGKLIESHTLDLFKKIFKDEAKYRISVCEKRKTNEHDLLIEYNKNLLIIEIKSSKTKEPLFNPKISYKKILDHFNSKKGIGGGYSQASKLKKYILDNENIFLYEQGEKKFSINKDNYINIFTLVITSEQFGTLNMDMTKAIKFDYIEEYPWSSNLYDLENFIQMLEYLNKDGNYFINYIKWRIENHEFIKSNDELDTFENYYLKKFPDKLNDIYFIPVPEFTLIDKIYFEKNGIKYHHPDFNKSSYKKIGRNSPCPCGSGIKYKKCCIDFS